MICQMLITVLYEKKIKIKYSNNIYLDTVQNIWNTRNGLFLSKESLKSTLSPYRLLGRTPFLMQSRERDHFECRHDSNVPSQTVWTELYCVLLWLCFSFPRLSLFPSCTFHQYFLALWIRICQREQQKQC